MHVPEVEVCVSVCVHVPEVCVSVCERERDNGVCVHVPEVEGCCVCART